jgi:uncharacterized protein (TIGR03435 family)
MTQRPAEVVNQFLKEFGNPPGRAIENSRESLLDRFASLEVHPFEVMDMPLAPVRPFRFAWAAGIVLAAVFLNIVVWRQGPPFAVAVTNGKADDRSMWTASSQQAGERLAVTVPPDGFELVSVKLLSPSSEAAKAAKTREEMDLALHGCSAGNMSGARIDPGRVIFPAVSVVTLVIVAYGHDCTLVEGGPPWARSGEYYEINALLPQGTPSYTVQALRKGEAPKLQGMLQNLLANRFRLVLRRELRDMPVYALTIANPGKLKASPDETRLSSFGPLGPAELARGRSMGAVSASSSGLSGEAQFSAHAISMSDLTTYLRPHAGRIVFDKTGVSDVFDADLKFVPEVAPRLPTNLPMPQPPNPPNQPIPPLPTAPTPSLKSELQEKLGLKLEATRMPVEVLVIQSVERPSEN